MFTYLVYSVEILYRSKLKRMGKGGKSQLEQEREDEGFKGQEDSTLTVIN